MKVIENSVEIWDDGRTIVPEPMAHLERCARVCYQSEGAKKPGESSEDFVNRVLLKHKDIRKNHMSVFEHVALYYMIPSKEVHRYVTLVYSKYSKYKVFNDTYYVSTNMRVLKEFENANPLTVVRENASSCTRYHDRRYTIYNVCNRGVADEFLRHRVLSFSHESTRYCNYSKDKFDNQLTFIIPNWCKEILDTSNWKCPTVENILYDSFIREEENYFLLLQLGWTPQQARAVLPNSLKSEIIMTGFKSDWEDKFLPLRLSPKAHPQMQEIAQMISNELNIQ